MHKLIWILVVWVGALPLSPAARGEDAQKPVYRQPTHDPGVSTLEQRGARQLATLHEFGVFAAFQFTDEVEASGIDFVHESVDDSLKDWIPVHYDHGNSVSVADIDGDGLTDVYFLTQIGSNALYRGLGAAKFENVTESAGVGLPDRISVAASFADVDNDGDPDLFVTTVRGGNVLFLNDGEGRFADVSAASGLDYVGHSSGSVFLDYDNDGLLDLFVTNVGTYTSDRKGRGGFYRGLEDAFQGHRHPERFERSKLYRNLGGARFEDVSEASGCCGDDGWAGDATFHDLNGDRLPDLYVLNMQGDDHYYENAGGGRFVEKGPEVFPRTPWGAMGVKFFDWDNDRRFDLIITDMHSDMHELDVEPLRDEKLKYDVPQDDDENNIDGNAFYRQNEDGSFDEISDANGAENYWPWGLSVADFNADGFEDVFIASSMNFPFRYGVNSLLLNDRGEMLRDSEFLLGVEPRRNGRTSKVLFDVDCDGADQDHPRCKERTGQASVAGSLGTRASAVFDLDQDGDLDIVTGEFNDRPQVLVSNLTENQIVRWIEIGLRGTSSNRDGLGARVTVVTNRGTVTRYHDGKSGYLAQSSMPLYVGLGRARTVERIEVEWPSGIDQSVTEGLQVNSRIQIIEPTAVEEVSSNGVE